MYNMDVTITENEELRARPTEKNHSLNLYLYSFPLLPVPRYSISPFSRSFLNDSATAPLDMQIPSLISLEVNHFSRLIFKK